jgi:hypothetical protein
MGQSSSQQLEAVRQICCQAKKETHEPSSQSEVVDQNESCLGGKKSRSEVVLSFGSILLSAA